MNEDKDIWDTLLTEDRVKSVVFENSSTLKEARYDSVMKALR